VRLDWGSLPVFIVGGGTSLKPYTEQLKTLHTRGFVLAVNDSYKYCKPDAVFSLDSVWLEKNQPIFPTLTCPVVVAVDKDAFRPEVPNLHYVERKDRNGGSHLSEDLSAITNGLNSGFGALNLAYQYGAKTIYLLGYDFMPGDNGDSHFHQGYRWHSARNAKLLYPKWCELFEGTLPQLNRAGVQVWNCSNRSLLKAYPYKSYEEIFA